MKTLRYTNLEKIMTIYTEISTYITFHNATGLTDINKSMEDFFIFALNKVLNTKLINANKDELNYPAIDLYDLEKKIAVQVTSVDDMQKKNETLEKFYKNNLNLKFNKLYIFFLKTKSIMSLPKFENGQDENLISLMNLTSLYKAISSLDDESIQQIADYTDKNYISTKNPPTIFINPKEINITEEDIKGLIHGSGQLIGSDDIEDDIRRAVLTYNNLFNIISKLSQHSRDLLIYVMSNPIFGEKELDYNIQSYYVLTDKLANHFHNYRSFANELAATEIARYDYEIVKSFFGGYPEALAVFYRGVLEDGNALAFLYDYLGYDYEKLRQVVVNLDFTLLK